MNQFQRLSSQSKPLRVFHFSSDRLKLGFHTEAKNNNECILQRTWHNITTEHKYLECIASAENISIFFLTFHLQFVIIFITYVNMSHTMQIIDFSKAIMEWLKL